jgi:hypothetical protein
MPQTTRPSPYSALHSRLRKSAAILASCAIGLIGVAGCGSSSSSRSTSTLTPSSNGLTIYPSTASVPVGTQVDFTGYVPSQPNSTITWAVSGSSAGSISSSGVYTAPGSVPSPAQVAVTATSGAFSASAVLTISAAQGVTVSPAAASIPAGSETTFSATVNGAAASGVTWEVNGSPGGDGVHGTIDASGDYTAPLSPPPGGSTVITAVVGASSGSATATVVFSNATLNGNYAFSYTGDDGSGFLAIAGEFTANGAGTVTGVEDFLDASTGPAVGQTLSGTYSIGPDGRGIVDLTSSTGEVWDVALYSNQHALLINFNQATATSSGATGSGTIDQQTATTALATGPYVFQLSGLDPTGYVVGIAGAFTSFGNGSLATSGNVMDMNDAATVTTDDTSLTGQFSATGLALQSSSFSTLVGGTASFAYFPVSNNHLHLIETDGEGFMVGDVFATPLAPAGGYNASLLTAGNYAFTMGGATQSPYAAGGVFISDGGGSSGSTSTSGSITGGVFDNNNGGVHLQTDATIQSTSYAVDQNNGNTGRITASTKTAAGTFDWVAYVTSPVDPTQTNSIEVLMLETDSNATASGVAYLQTSTAQPSGTFAFNLTGQANGSTPGEQDILAQLAISQVSSSSGSSGSLSGTMDINNFAAGTIDEGLEIQTSKSAFASTDGNGRGTMTVVAADGASFGLAYYVVNSNEVLLLENDSQRVMTGIMQQQF